MTTSILLIVGVLVFRDELRGAAARVERFWERVSASAPPAMDESER